MGLRVPGWSWRFIGGQKNNATLQYNQQQYEEIVGCQYYNCLSWSPRAAVPNCVSKEVSKQRAT